MPLPIKVCGVAELTAAAAHEHFSHVISIWDSSRAEQTDVKKEMHRLFPKAQIHFAFFDDVDQTIKGCREPNLQDVEAILDFGASVREHDRLLVHCHAGISRSTASAFAILCQRKGPGRESQAFTMVKTLRPILLPNLLVVRLADDLLDRGGTMVREAIHHRGMNWPQLALVV